MHTTTVLVIPDDIEEEDDDNFASDMSRLSFLEKSILTPLAPPPSGLRFPTPATGTSTPRDLEKPLPMLPEMMVQPLKLRGVVLGDAANVPRSHFSTSTVSTTSTQGSWRFSGGSELTGSEDGDVDDESSADLGRGDESWGGICAYRLPEEEERVLKTVGGRTTFGGMVPFSPDGELHEGNLSALQELMSEMGYLGEAIRK